MKIKKELSVGKTIKVFKFYPYFMYWQLDKWLKKMSAKGWHIVHCNLFCFWFEKGEAKEKEYFTYCESTHEGKYSILLRYPFLKKTYGVKNKYSKINANNKKTYEIIEIDLNKTNVLNDTGYVELVKDRNRLYRKLFLRNVSLFIIFIIALVLCPLFI